MNQGIGTRKAAGTGVGLSANAAPTFSMALLAACVFWLCAGPAVADAPNSPPPAAPDEPGRWAMEAAVAIISEKGIDELFRREGTVADGPGGGEIYLFTAYYTVERLEWRVGDRVFRPNTELHFKLGVVDENARSPFFDYNVAFAMRWNDFPWNRFVHTTFSTGVGFSYTERILLMDQQRHPGRDRSHLKFDWPLQLTFAHPRHQSHQLVVFNHHLSGGMVFDRGGVNAHGIGYRHVF